ncbi:group II intron reverse transcriptase/maturase [Listeria monocytogenes]|jgi:group II intron reverse transcriptase/maturase|uniref:reverse transcriptase domain-containing protein n=1 Tax=Listeria monocytogenes TaxID=1639 RepID=UPI000BDE91E4|nr:reverse transcriptase domain-containing protein [Listeria monocytogenes]MCI1965104.1 reverse transcriptase domain-containing protein [Oscillospiraceae bacterium]PCV54029.1 group II intron reverse transcriptase/maturase [Listeria monocytogenes]PDB18223.1 group II intron reverse transcriptase/maturase [Listeria monocytogenes]PDE41319.1 group II intron reverse transcriptase/maturase [Listeria monocytogenes]HAJ9217943.1 group II intron reverse transcriptase/maturase [Listeria monocytogenes]
MAQQFDYPKNETDLRVTLDALYSTAKTAVDGGKRPSFTGLIELMSCEATIMTAIHNIKANKGSETPGVDGWKMQRDYLQKPFRWVINDIQRVFSHFVPEKIRRVYIDKPGKAEKRPLGIPAIRDRIVQECIRIVLEPILEAQSYKYSFGFRPMRDTQMAMECITNYVHKTGYHWIVEGDISKCFDRINHGTLLKRLYHIGVKDKRLLQIVKVMLKAGIIGECEINEDGTPQGGILSPLLANVYMDILDEWVSKQWLTKSTRYEYSRHDGKIDSLRKRSNLRPAYLIRYADDFVLITNSHANALWWKDSIKAFLENVMRLSLSEEKTLITDVRRKHIHFLGYEYKVVPGKAKKGYIPRTLPDRKRLKRKVDEISAEWRKIPLSASREKVIHELNLINSKIRGLINYYENCTWVNATMKKYSRQLEGAAKRRLKQYKGKLIPANQTQNLINVHQCYTTKIPSIRFRDIWIGVSRLDFCCWKKPVGKIQAETPYTEEGRTIYFQRTRKKRMNARLDEIISMETSELVSSGQAGRNYNFEFFMNRAYALNRDKLKCRVCGRWLITGKLCTHRINPHLPLGKVNKVNNLASMDRQCFALVNNRNADISHFDTKTRSKVEKFRKQLVKSHNKTTV